MIKKIALLTLLMLSSGIFAFAQNVLFLKIKDGKLELEKKVSDSGTGNEETPVFDYKLLTIQVSGTADEVKKVSFVLTGNSSKDGCAAGSALDTFAAFKENTAMPFAAMLKKIKLDDLPSRMHFSFLIAGQSANLDFCVQKVGAVEKATTANLLPCLNPSFYELAAYRQIYGVNKASKFYVLTQDLKDFNSVPQIKLYDPLKPDEVKTAEGMKVGRSLIIQFKGYEENYGEIKAPVSFRDFNLEDKSLFQSFLAGGKSSTASTEKTTDDGKKDKTTEGVTPVEYKNAINVLITQLKNLQNDLDSKNIDERYFFSVLEDLKHKLVGCFPGLSEGKSSALAAYFLSKNFDAQTKALGETAVSVLSSIERTIGKREPSVQLKNADEVAIDVSYFGKGSTTADVIRQWTYPLLWGWKVDFSSGLILSSLVNEKYLITEASSVTDPATNTSVDMKMVLKEKQSDVRPGLGVLAHFYPRMSKWFSLGLTSGFLLNENLAVQFPVGLSAMLGRESRLVLSGGVIGGEVKRLSAKYNEGVAVKATSLANISEENLLSTRTKAGWFLSVTYNFGGTNLGGTTGK
ncbi:hypothetical protein IM793_06235 [Pedobacter sp. MR2016-19]|uniref:hypothetical protein n=1 Tax=Pedobacter sp. MR2016-19 TaxID=2780089 RepID=UPI0018737E1E|nr:hypothetical protein [Pedobacter sp. MR2016-19]MBE5318743.1 hypothetical protein [Pedobacter sp. MR2016-19]